MKRAVPIAPVRMKAAIASNIALTPTMEAKSVITLSEESSPVASLTVTLPKRPIRAPTKSIVLKSAAERPVTDDLTGAFFV